jgi:membrane protease YdiL (CAAX protease family)
MKHGKFITLFSYFVPFIAMIIGFYLVKNVWVAMLGYHFLAVLMLIANKQSSLIKRLFVGGTWGSIIFCSVLAALSGGVLYLFSQVIQIPMNFGTMLETMGLKSANWLLFILYYSLINPIIEEVYWRGYLGSMDKTLTWSDVCYAGYHPLVFLRFVPWPWALVEFAILLGVAWLWRMLIRKYGGLLLPVLMHLFADLSIGIAIYLLARSIP